MFINIVSLFYSSQHKICVMNNYKIFYKQYIILIYFVINCNYISSLIHNLTFKYLKKF